MCIRDRENVHIRRFHAGCHYISMSLNALKIIKYVINTAVLRQQVSPFPRNYRELGPRPHGTIPWSWSRGVTVNSVPHYRGVTAGLPWSPSPCSCHCTCAVVNREIWWTRSDSATRIHWCCRMKTRRVVDWVRAVTPSHWCVLLPTSLKSSHHTVSPRATYLPSLCSDLLAAWRSGNVVGRINEVTLRQARLVLGWVTVRVRLPAAALYFGM